MKPVRLAPEALEELRDAAAWYRERSPQLARRFLDHARETSRTIARAPLQFPMLSEPALTPPVRRALISGFPYALVFILDRDATVHVLAVAHQHRMPGYWLHRLRDV